MWVELDRWGTGMVHSAMRGTCGLMICNNRGSSVGVFRGVISVIVWSGEGAIPWVSAMGSGVLPLVVQVMKRVWGSCRWRKD